ncbi:protein of unknown function DUF1566 [Desulfovibrio sp. X2]|uniref:Lcl C-terminal domain-containing protein n=1 Tax=Desulfovibrio sp. X2 TaxID=941449 RepID=UPI000358D5A2|nr:DUF1566 domain-containing protein [Desulfovibrio sp. X2]EPR43670.1 protein of unknown function DUF1566 [Desulfovibrio sp. X2]
MDSSFPPSDPLSVPTVLPPLWSGLDGCYDPEGLAIDCRGTWQDADLRPGLAWPEPRFEPAGDGIVLDRLTGLCWSSSANPFSFPMTWEEGLRSVAAWNAHAHLGRTDWRMPNRVELRSIVSHGARKPALPKGHPFRDVFLGWVWSSTSAAIAPTHAWRVHLEGGRTFYGRKVEESLVWPVAGTSAVLPRSGQTLCYDAKGGEIACTALAAGQDGGLGLGGAWPKPRFAEPEDGGEGVLDRLTGLVWARLADQARSGDAPGLTDWAGALALAAEARERSGLPWRLPAITELESLVDCSRAEPALPGGHPFAHPGEAYWSATSSYYGPDWAYCLYLHKGAVGVGYKPGPEFLVWLVRSLPSPA